MMVETGAGPVELIEDGIPPHLLERSRAWFAREVRKLERSHGPHWPAHRDWLIEYLNAELRELVAKAGGARHAV
jgi:hypothetical protein